MIDKIEEFGLNILRKIKLGKLADIYEEHREGMRYLVFGVLSTVVNILIFTVCKKAIGIGTVISNIIAWIFAVIFAYITNKLWVFDSKTSGTKDFLREIISFFGARVFTLFVETIFLKIVIDRLGFNETIMKIVSNIIVIIINFLLSKLIIFKNNKDERKEKNG